MPVGQRKACRAVIKRGAQPAVELVAALAIAGCKSRSRRRVWRIRGVLPVLQMAGVARGRKAQKYTCSSLLVTLFARHSGVCAQQWKPVLVVADRLHRDIPTLHRMALFAIGTHLPPVYVRVAISAVLSHVRENRLHVALHAFHFFMHAPQGITGLVVVKLRHRPDWTPTRRCVAVLAGNVQRRPMRIACRFLLGGSQRCCRGGKFARGTPGWTRECQ
jgi:hypothetical protein